MDLNEAKANTERHPWELSRADQLLCSACSLGNLGDIADVGSGDRFFTALLKTKTQGSITAIDTGYLHSDATLDGIRCIQTLEQLETHSVDTLIMMDVLEHVPDEDTFLQIALERLRPRGKLMLTVPAMQNLFSSHDVSLKHFRRYHRKQLRQVLERNGIHLQRCHYFYASLVPPRLITCLLEKITHPDPSLNEGIGGWSHATSHPLTRMIRKTLNLDFRLMKQLDRIGIHPPGLSLLAIGHKNT